MPPSGGRNFEDFQRKESGEAPGFIALSVDMALATCGALQATRHVSYGIPGV